MPDSLSKNFVTYGIGNVLYTLVTLLLVPVYIEKIEINDYGILSIFLVSINLIMVFFSINIQNGILRAFNEGFNRDKEGLWLTTIIMFFLLGGIAFYAFTLIFQGPLSNLIFSDNKYGKFVVLSGLVGFSRVFHGLFTGVLRARNESLKYVILNLINVVSLALINIYIIYFTDFSLLSIAWGYFINGLFTNVLGLVFIASDLRIGFDFAGLKYLMKYGVPLGVANVISYFINFGNRYFLINYTNETNVALMDVGQKIAGIVGILFSTAFLTAFTPYYLNLYYKVSFEDFTKKINQIIISFSVFYCFFGLGIVMFQDLGLSLLSKQEYLVAAKFVPYLILSNLFYVLFMLLTMGTNIKKKTKIEMYITIVIFVFSIILNVVLIKIIGIYGALYTQVVINFMSLVLIILYNKKSFPVKIDFMKIARLILIFGILCFLKEAIPKYLNIDNMLTVRVFIPIGLTVTFILLNYSELISMKSNLINMIKKT
jgi:O-antigen/teichoic acid export membrane protein